jgi:hypothetical protein
MRTSLFTLHREGGDARGPTPIVPIKSNLLALGDHGDDSRLLQISDRGTFRRAKGTAHPGGLIVHDAHPSNIKGAVGDRQLADSEKACVFSRKLCCQTHCGIQCGGLGTFVRFHPSLAPLFWKAWPG